MDTFDQALHFNVQCFELLDDDKPLEEDELEMGKMPVLPFSTAAQVWPIPPGQQW